MNPKILTIILLFGLSTLINAEADPAEDGKYRPRKYNKIDGNNGRYVPTNEGRYVPMNWPYMHVHDNRELGRYVHIHNPYDGGYGPYSGDIDKYRYLGDNRGDYSLYTVSNSGDLSSSDPFNTQIYDIPKPDVLLEYGFPDHTPKKIEKRSIASPSTKDLKLKNTILKSATTNNLLVHNINQNDGKQQTKNLDLDSQTTTTTTTTPRPTKPRLHYDDEGKWRIIRQEEDKNPKRYDYLYLTENGIYAEEQAKTVNSKQEETGTMGKGYYHYTGDDGELYQVHYSAGEEGFIPMAEHLPSQLKKALEYLAAKNKAESEAEATAAQRLGK